MATQTGSIDLAASSGVKFHAEGMYSNMPNLSPYYSADLADIYNATDNPDGYWASNPVRSSELGTVLTQGDDGWAHLSMDNSERTSNAYLNCYARHACLENTSTKHTFLIEVRGYSGSGGFVTYQQEDSTAMTQQLAYTSGNTSLAGDGEYRIVRTSKSNFTGCTCAIRLTLRLSPGATFDGDIRVSIYEGEYTGPYKPYGGKKLFATQANLKVQADRITSEVSAREELAGIVSNHATAIQQNSDSITLSAKKSETIDNMLYDADAPSNTKVFGPANRYYSHASSSTYVTPSIVSISDPPETGIEHASQFVCNGNNTSAVYRAQAFYVDIGPVLTAGQSYVISWWARRTDDGTGDLKTFVDSYNTNFPNLPADKRPTLTSDWTLVTYSVKATATASTIVRFYAWFPANTAGTIQLCGFKIVPQTYATSAEFKVASDEISAKVDKDGVIAAINLSSEQEGGSLAKISADKVEIDGTAIFTNSDFREAADAAYDAKGAADAVQVGVTNLLLGTKVPVEMSTNAANAYPVSNELNTVAASDELTLSFWAKSDVPRWIDLYWTTGSSYSNNESNFYPAFELTTEWARYTYTGAAGPGAATAVYLRLRQNASEHASATTGATIDVRLMKLEKGNRATDWTPAPEDVAEDITSAESNAKDYANDIQVAGENLLRRTARFVATTWARSNVSVPRAGVLRMNVTSSASPSATYKVNYLDWDDYGTGTYTLSFEARKAPVASTATVAMVNAYIAFHPISRYDNPVSSGYSRYKPATAINDIPSEWKRYTVTGTCPDEFTTGQASALASGSNLTVHFYIASGDKYPIEIRRVKLEKGDVATSYSEAPDDALIPYGGRNLLRNTGAAKTITIESDGSGTYTTSYAASSFLNSLELVGDETVLTYSFDYEVTGTVADNAYIYPQFHGTAPASGQSIVPAQDIESAYNTVYVKDAMSGHYRCTFVITAAQATSTDINTNRIRLMNANAGATARIWNVKLEQGLVETPWTPAPEDVDASISSVSTVANNAAPKTDAVKRTQRIYYRTSSDSTPATPGTTSSNWVVNGNTSSSWTKYNAWSTRVPPIADSTESTTKYLYLYTCEQREMGNGTIAYTTVLLDDSTTVIDGGNIITGSVTANEIDATNLHVSSANIDGEIAFGKLTNVPDYAMSNDIPTKVSDLNNDSGFQTSAQVESAITGKGYALNSSLTTEINQRKAQYGTCTETAAGTTPKAVTCSNFELVAGNELTVKFTNANTSAAKIQLNVNSKGAKDVWVANAVTSATNQLLWGAGAYITFRYDGTQFQVIGEPRTWYGASTTDEDKAAKTDTTAVTGCVICKGAKVELAMSNANTAASPTLNVQSTGAKAVYFGNGTTRPTKAGGTSWLAENTCTFTFDGAAWRTQGKTYIDANSIVTGYLSADRIEAGSLNADKINVSSISIGALSGSIGGRNLLRFTTSPSYVGVYTGWANGTEPSGWYSYRNDCTVTRTDYGIKIQGGSSSNDGFVIPLTEELVSGDGYMLSFTYRGTVDTTGEIYVLCRTTPNVKIASIALNNSGNWAKFESKVSWSGMDGKTPYALLLPYRNNASGWLEIKDASIKLEKGDRATDWTPAPEDFTAYVDSVQLGVTNLLLETATWGSKLWLNSSGAAISGDTVTYASNNTSNRMALIPCSSGDVFTVSYDVKASVAVTYGANGGTILVDYSNSTTSYNRVVYETIAGNSSVGTEWQRVSYTFTVPTNSSIKALTIGLRNMSPSTTCTLYFRYFKLERGSRATDWTPAPEDVVSDINAVQSNLDNLQIGSRNLLKRSDDLNLCFSSTSAVTSIVGGKADPDGGTGAFLITPSSTSWYAGTTSGYCVLKNLKVPYTFSIWLRADTATQCKLCCRYMDGTPYSSTATRVTFDVTTEWQRFYISAPLKQAQATDSVWIGQVTNVPIYAYHPKVEIGTRPSDWTPAKEDVEASIDTVQNNLDMSRSWYAECPTAAATTAKVATITPTTTSFTTETLTPGTIVHVKFAATNSGSAGSLTLNVNGTGAKPIKYVASGGSIANIPGNGYLVINNTYEFYYDGTNWVVQMPYNTNNYDRENYKAAVVASAAISSGRIAVFGTDHKLKTLAASAFDVSCPILYVATTYTADDATNGTARSTNYTFWGSTFNLTNTHSIQGAAAGLPVFIVGTLSGTTFTPNSTVLTCTVPTSVNNLVYLRLGLMSTATNAVLESDHPMYMFFDGKFQQCDPATASAACSATNYISMTGSGIKIANANPSTATTYQLQTSTGTDFVVANAVRNRVNADGMTLYDGSGVADGNIVAKFANKLIELGKNAADAVIKLCNGKLELSYFNDTDNTGIQFGSLYATNYLKLWSGFADGTRTNQHSEVMAYASQGHLSTSLLSTRDTSGRDGTGGKKEAKVDAIAPEVGNARIEASFDDEGTTGSLVYDKNGIAISGWTSIKAIYMGTDVFTLSNGQWMQLKSAAQVTTLLGSGASQTNTICIAQNGDFNTYAGVVTGAMGQDGSARAYIYPNRTGGIRINYMLIRFA